MGPNETPKFLQGKRHHAQLLKDKSIEFQIIDDNMKTQNSASIKSILQF